MAEAFDLERRVHAHRRAWDRISGHESDVLDSAEAARKLADTIELRRPLYETWPYRRDLDWIIEAPDGRWVANCIMWYDEINRVGTLEPVGTDADFRRQGFGAAVCLAALHAVKLAGAIEARVGARGDAAYPVPRQVYRSIGYRPLVRDLIYRRAR